MIRSIVVILLACFGTATASLLAAQQGSVTFTGVVRDQSGAPLPGAVVVAEGPSAARATTDPTGAYTLGPLPDGAYTLRVEAAGYLSQPRRVAAGAGTALEWRLRPSPVMLGAVNVVSAFRGTGTAAAALPVKVEVISPEQIAVQRGLATNPSELLTNLIPSFSPSRQKLSTAGESFRGRRPLFLIDGVPQSNPLRDGQREGFTIDMEAIERVEVVFGANAIQGLGATGGIVNYVTVTPPVSGELEQRASVSTTSNDALEGDGLGWRGHYMAGKRFEKFDVLGSVSYETRGLQFDGLDQPIALDNVQGDIADSWSRNLMAKLGWEPGASQRLQLMVNDFRLEQRGRFDMVTGNRALGIPAISVEGEPEGIEPINDVTTASLDYEHRDFWGANLSAKAFFQDFSALYGGGRFATFQDPRIAPVGEVFDQSENNSQKFGTRLTYVRSDIARSPLDVIAGFDFLRDKTNQRLAITDRTWVPPTTFINYAPFAQLDAQLGRWLSLSGGLRWEIAQLDVPEFTALAGNRRDFALVTVAGGSPGFDEPLLNIGGVLSPIEGLRLYSTISQAYTMPDVGRVLRGISVQGTSVAQFLDLSPIKTDNLEFGGTFGNAWSLLGVTYFESESDLGSRLVANADGIFQVRREPTKTSGWEVTGRLEPVTRYSIDLGYSNLEGHFDADRDGTLESELTAADIGPNRLNAGLDLNRGGVFSGRLQGFHFFDRDFHDVDGEVDTRFDGYTTVDASAAFQFGSSAVTLSIANLLDKQYITYYSQAATDLNDRYFAGRGRTVTLRLESRF